jgi:hypothetical protein
MVEGWELLSRVLSFNDALREVGSSSSGLVSFARVAAAHAGVVLFYYFWFWVFPFSFFEVGDAWIGG